MNNRNTTILVLASFFFFSGTALAEMPQGQLPDATSFQQTDESAEFAAYEFEEESVSNEAYSENIKKTSDAGDNHEWNPEEWSEIP